MSKEEEEPFELDEPAARSHTPPGWRIETLEVKPDARASKRYGPDTFRFSAALTLSVILPRRGWTLVKKTKNYAYLIPSPDQLKPPFRITIAVPPADECLALANRSFARGESWMGQLGEWPAWYVHERNRNMQLLSRDPATGAMVGEVIEQPRQSSLTIGEWGLWQAVVTGIDGRFGRATCRRIYRSRRTRLSLDRPCGRARRRRSNSRPTNGTRRPAGCASSITARPARRAR